MSRNGPRTGLTVLFLNRPGSASHPGGDTVLMTHLRAELVRKGVTVEVDCRADLDLSQFDLVHLFNLPLAEHVERCAANALSQNVPFVVTSLQEDFASYLGQAEAAYDVICADLRLGRSRRDDAALVQAIRHAEPRDVPRAPVAAGGAARVFACGQGEAALLKRLYPGCRVTVAPVGSSIATTDISPNEFRQRFGVHDFVLCVGRVELRKNQLMLLKALESDPVTVVFADGGFTYTPEYRDACERFPRDGRTVFTGWLSDAQLASAYHACSVHCLPSWYELPGLATLEAARCGCPVVASSAGAITEYLGNSVILCAPEDPASIRAAINEAQRRPRGGLAQRLAESFTWEASAQVILDTYLAVVSARRALRLPIA